MRAKKETRTKGAPIPKEVVNGLGLIKEYLLCANFMSKIIQKYSKDRRENIARDDAELKVFWAIVHKDKCVE